MITVISGTNRPKNRTRIVAEKYVTMLRENTSEEVAFLSLESLPSDIFHLQMYESAHQASGLVTIQDKFIFPADKFVFLAPEYNGSFPGVLKLFIDACSVRNYKQNFKGKKAALIGTSDGRAGNLRGMDHLTGLLNYLGVNILPNRLPISLINSVINKETLELTDEPTLKLLSEQALEFINF